jgi:hypothetical protein
MTPLLANATEQLEVAVSICRIIFLVLSLKSKVPSQKGKDFGLTTIDLRLYGTGSCPCPPQGLQLAIRFKVNHPPLKGPCFFIASTAYCEQVGVYLHEAPVSGDIKYW